MSQLGYLFDQRYCIGCQACQTACQVKNATPVGISLRRAVSFEDVPEGPFVSVSCNHCANPACVAACPVGSMVKHDENGLVYNDPETCIGCGACVQACPYDAPVINPDTQKSIKCDMCHDLIEAGELPSCVRACPVKVLTYGELSDLDALGVAEAPGFTVAETEPSIRFIVA